MNETEERALRAVVREVIQNGLIDENSAWAPFVAKRQPIFESTWDEIAYMAEGHWYDKKATADNPEGKSKGYDKDKKRGAVKKHGIQEGSIKESQEHDRAVQLAQELEAAAQKDPSLQHLADLAKQIVDMEDAPYNKFAIGQGTGMVAGQYKKRSSKFK